MSLTYGLGDSSGHFKVYIANQPNFQDFNNLVSVHPLCKGEIFAIGQTCGNGWRKVFNVYAKLIFALNSKKLANIVKYDSWQEYRDKTLLQKDSNTALLFSAPILPPITGEKISIVMGKTYASSLNLPSSLVWLDNDFAIDHKNKLIVCPYFDYRQLSNIKILRLIELINRLTK